MDGAGAAGNDIFVHHRGQNLEVQPWFFCRSGGTEDRQYSRYVNEKNPRLSKCPWPRSRDRQTQVLEPQVSGDGRPPLVAQYTFFITKDRLSKYIIRLRSTYIVVSKTTLVNKVRTCFEVCMYLDHFGGLACTSELRLCW